MTSLAGSGALSIASWNVGHRLGSGKYKPEFVEAIPELRADLVCLNEYYPRKHDDGIRARLRSMGFAIEVSGPTTKVANLTLVASRVPIRRAAFEIDYFDDQMPSNTLAVEVPSHDLLIVALRIPMYTKTKAPLMAKAWQILERALVPLRQKRVMLIGDLNCSLEHRRGAGRPYMARLMESGWCQAGAPGTRTFFSTAGHQSWVDHCLHTPQVSVSGFEVLKAAGGYVLADGPDALSDHAAIRVTVAGDALTSRACPSS